MIAGLPRRIDLELPIEGKGVKPERHRLYDAPRLRGARLDGDLPGDLALRRPVGSGGIQLSVIGLLDHPSTSYTYRGSPPHYIGEPFAVKSAISAPTPCVSRLNTGFPASQRPRAAQGTIIASDTYLPARTRERSRSQPVTETGIVNHLPGANISRSRRRVPDRRRRTLATLDDVSAADGIFDPTQVDRGRSYHRPLYWARVAGIALDLAVLALLAFTVVGDDLYALSDGRSLWVRGVVFSLLTLALTAAVALPIGLWAGYVHEHEWALSTQSLGGWCLDRLKGLAVGLALTTAALLGLLAAARAWPIAWPVIVAAAAVFLVLTLSYLAPVVLEPLFSHFENLLQIEISRQACRRSAPEREFPSRGSSLPTRVAGRAS